MLYLTSVFSFENTPYWNQLHNDDNWILVNKTERTWLYTKKLSISPLPAYKIELISIVDKAQLIDAAWQIENSVDIFPNSFIIEAGIYKSLENSYTAYQIIDIPALSPRLYQFNSKKYNDRIHWAGSDTIKSNLHLDDYVLPPINFGSWTVKSTDSNTILTYRLCTNPGGIIPLWIVDKANQKYLPQLLIDLEKYTINNKLETQ
tara:strand:- start:156 stop:767 length:612 start_codon:yes stop_codon:yes gene_type:complete